MSMQGTLTTTSKAQKPALTEEAFLEGYVTALRAKLRPEDEDGIKRPTLIEPTRVPRGVALKHGTAPSTKQRLVTLRIWACMLLQYQHRCSKRKACRILEEDSGGKCRKDSISSSHWKYSTAEEYAYSPYTYGAPTAAEVEAEMKERHMAVVWDYKPDDRVHTRGTFTFQCTEEGLGHPDWSVQFLHIWYEKTGCQECYNLRRGEKSREGHARKRLHEAGAPA